MSNGVVAGGQAAGRASCPGRNACAKGGQSAGGVRPVGPRGQPGPFGGNALRVVAEGLRDGRMASLKPRRQPPPRLPLVGGPSLPRRFPAPSNSWVGRAMTMILGSRYRPRRLQDLIIPPSNCGGSSPMTGPWLWLVQRLVVPVGGADCAALCGEVGAVPDAEVREIHPAGSILVTPLETLSLGFLIPLCTRSRRAFNATRCRIFTVSAPSVSRLASPRIKGKKQVGAFAPPIPHNRSRSPVRATSRRAAPQS